MEEETARTIQNLDALATTPARTSLLAIAESGYRAIRTADVIARAVQCADDTLTLHGTSYNLASYEHLYVICIGKCALDSARELERLLGERITDGVALDVRDGEPLTRVRAYVGTHPYPSKENVQYTREILTLAEKAGPHDLVLTVVSGGGSTLLCQPKSHTAEDEIDLVRHLFKKGATIQEINTVRKHLSEARGGGVAAAAYPAELAALIFSDVPGDDLATISSGPTVQDTTTRDDAVAVFRRYEVRDVGFEETHLFESPKDATVFANVHNELVLTNRTALEAMHARAEELGYTATIRETTLQGEARDVATRIARELHEAPPRTVWLYGGETTVTITGPGKGGRNEEFALGALIEGRDDELFLSLASDGRDNTEYAGAISDEVTRSLAREHEVRAEDYLYTNDSFSFFHTLHQGVVTGYTGSNIADVVIVMKHDVDY